MPVAWASGDAVPVYTFQWSVTKSKRLRGPSSSPRGPRRHASLCLPASECARALCKSRLGAASQAQKGFHDEVPTLRRLARLRCTVQKRSATWKTRNTYMPHSYSVRMPGRIFSSDHMCAGNWLSSFELKKKNGTKGKKNMNRRVPSTRYNSTPTGCIIMLAVRETSLVFQFVT